MKATGKGLEIRNKQIGQMRRLKFAYEAELECIQKRATFCPKEEVPNLMIRWKTLSKAIKYMEKCFAAGKMPYWKALP